MRGTLTQHDVRLVVGDFRGRSADELARAVTRVVRGLIIGYRKASRKLVNGGESDTDAPSLFARELEPYFAALERIDLEVTGPRGVAMAVWKDDEPTVHLRRNVPLSAARDLSEEITAAVSALLDAHAVRTAELFDEHYPQEYR
ncbi:hypothetical protein [Stackebrandtia nassauensis]|uniref:hypothetical protein n=1 Tax=Stackebrandtia nassauensis TaxID=283811 RepID=UPI0001A39C1F|nr:hypothetical protein [Stackebrandtia nassauensis]